MFLKCAFHFMWGWNASRIQELSVDLNTCKQFQRLTRTPRNSSTSK